MAWELQSHDNGRQVVVPLDDLRAHIVDDLCPCMPSMLGKVEVHNSYDKREVGAALRLAICSLLKVLEAKGVTLEELHQNWVNKALRLLDMHWPGSGEPDWLKCIDP